MNFDYFKELGVFTDTHQAALDSYMENIAQISGDMFMASTSKQTKASALSALWGQIDYVVHAITGVVTDTTRGGAATQANEAFAADDEYVVVKRVNNVISTEKKILLAAGEPAWPAGAIYAIKYLLPAAGKIGGKEVAVEAKQDGIEQYEKKLETETNASVIAKINDAIDALESEIAAIRDGDDGLYKLTYDACVLAFEIDVLDAQFATLSENQLDEEADLVIALGDMLRDGYWSNTNYVPGQEQALYDDALEVSKEMSKPEITYSIGVLDLSETTGHECDDFKTNQRLRIYDPE